MPRLLARLFGGSKPARDYSAGPKLAGLDPVSEAAIALQKAHWRLSLDELDELEARAAKEGLTALPWPEALRLHQLRCLATLHGGSAGQPNAASEARRRLLGPEDDRPASAPAPASIIRRHISASAQHLLSRRSPYRPRHGFAWLGAGPPEGEAIPYSDLQGRVVCASLAHLGALEVVTLDERLEPAGLDFLAFDDIQTLSFAPRPATLAAAAQPPFRPARVIREYGKDPLTVLVPLRHGLSWYAFEPALLRGDQTRCVAELALEGLADPAKRRPPLPGQPALPGDRRPLGVAAGLVRVEVLSDYAEEGLGSFSLAEAYQLSLAIDQDDPRFADKCRGRGLDPQATRGDVVREARLRASARAKRGSQS
ncbi:hypothetical protein G6O69_20710 [Pseudenhygromyxa sp. WMMC2535]|uniref:hypothetical protein n=1 Tax=Pseudenhygromyxa sp. WMMC2535 TaxID=2712867 RepID=UPI0015579B52|nr:hypothetical protein [Pseudenhygromyxa sp. WMMC2535]NVB40276.1 hypothetical protein [Pseudenhygromyxa sp. WMMC2535]